MPSYCGVEVSRRFHLDRSGACGYVIELAVNQRDLTPEKIIFLASSAESPDTVLEIADDSPHRDRLRYKDDTWSLKRVLAGNEGDNAFKFIFQRDVRNLAEHLQSLQKPPNFEWLDEPDMSHSIVDHQLPFTLIVLHFDSQQSYVDFLPYDNTFAECARPPLDFRLRRFGALLFRWKTKNTGNWEDVDITYLTDVQRDLDPPILANMHVHRDIYIANNIRSCLVAANISDESDDGEKLEKYTVPSLEATLASIRAQWHAYLVINAHLDGDVDDLRGPLSGDLKNAFLRVITRKSLLLKVLDSTTSHKLASDTLWRLYRQTSQLLGITELREQALAKIELLERLVSSEADYFVFLPNRRTPSDSEADG